jgi:hypothetical protein
MKRKRKNKNVASPNLSILLSEIRFAWVAAQITSEASTLTACKGAQNKEHRVKTQVHYLLAGRGYRW